MTLQDKFDIYAESQQKSPTAFLKGLIKDERVGADSALISQIKHILSKIHRFAKYQIFSYAKGLWPFGRVKEGATDPQGNKLTKEQIEKINKGVEPGYYDYTKTEDYKNDMMLLFDGMGINKYIRSPEMRKSFEALKEFIPSLPEDLDVDSERGYFTYTQDNKRKSFVLMTKEQFKEIGDYLEGRELPAVPGHEEFVLAEKDCKNGHYLMIDPDSAQYRAYLSHTSLARDEREEKWEAPVFDEGDKKKPEKAPEPAVQEPTQKPERVDCRKMNPEEKREVTKQLMGRMDTDPTIRNRLRVRGQLVDTLIKKGKDGNPIVVRHGKQNTEHYIVKLPGKDNIQVLVQKKQIAREGGSRFWAINVPAKWQYFRCDDKGEMLKGEDGKVLKVDGAKVIADHITPVSYVIDPPEATKEEVKYTYLHGFQVGYNDQRAVIYGFDPNRADKESYVIDRNEETGEEIVTGVLRLPDKIPGTEIRFDTIRDKAFAEKDYFNGVIIPEGYKYIGKEAFRNTPIESLILPDTVESLGVGVCAGCYALASAKLPRNLNILPEDAFLNSVLNSIDVSHVETFGNRALKGTMVTELDMTGASEIGHEAIGYCTALKGVALDASRFPEEKGLPEDYALESPKIEPVWVNLTPEQEKRVENRKEWAKEQAPADEGRTQGTKAQTIEREYDKQPSHGRDIGTDIDL